jgi:SAM-dependent methyltransferase
MKKSDQTNEDTMWFESEKAYYEPRYLSGKNPRRQSGFGRDALDWERYRRCVVSPIQENGKFLDIGCANGLLMEDVVRWSKADGFLIEPYGLDISEKLVALARQRLPEWQDRFFVGNALYWDPPFRFDYVRTELVYVPDNKRRIYVERLFEKFLNDNGRLLICSYGSSRPEGHRTEPLLNEIHSWGIKTESVTDVNSDPHGFVITRVVCILKNHIVPSGRKK